MRWLVSNCCHNLKRVILRDYPQQVGLCDCLRVAISTIYFIGFFKIKFFFFTYSLCILLIDNPSQSSPPTLLPSHPPPLL